MDLFKILGTIAINNGDAMSALDNTSSKASKVGQVIGNVASGIGKTVVAVSKVAIAGVIAASTAVGALTTMSVNAYGDFEQLVGGAELLFGDAFATVQKNAQEAYSTVQMSQNEYLQQVNGFAIGLKTALGGNEQAAADLSHKIIKAEADIVAATGNSQEAVQNAFNGIMKSNYTMLDNLQLGITPTKEGMQEVIDKVNEWNTANGNATSYMIDNLADCQAALVDYVEMQGLAGYAANEAAGTIQGSLAAIKASWQNLVVGLSDDTQDFGALLDSFVSSATQLVGNIMPRVQTVFSKIPDLISGLVPQVVELLNTLLPSLLNSVTALIDGLVNDVIPLIPGIIENMLPSLIEAVMSLANGLVGALPQIVGVLSTVVITLAGYILELLPQILNVGIEVIVQLANGITQAIPQLLPAVVNTITTLVNTILTNMPLVLNAVIQLVMAIVRELPSISANIYKALPEIISNLANIIIELYPMLADAILEYFNLIAEEIPKNIPIVTEALPQIIDAVVMGLIESTSAIAEATILVFTTMVEVLPQITGMLIKEMPKMVVSVAKALLKNKDKFFSAAKDLLMLLVKAIPFIIFPLEVGLALIVKSILTKLKEPAEELFKKIWAKLVDLFSPVGSFFKNKFDKAMSNIKTAFQPFVSFFKGRWDATKNNLSNVGTFFKSIFDRAMSNIRTSFSGFVGFFRGLYTSLTSIFTSVGTSVGNAISGSVKAAVNSVLGTASRAINGFIDAINIAVGVLNKLPGGGGIRKISRLSVPYLSQGGILKRGQVGVLEGDGAEAVVPLEKNTEWISKVADQFNGQMGGNDTLEAVYELLQRFFDWLIKNGNRQIILDSGVLVGELAPLMDSSLGSIDYIRRRGG